MHAIVEKLEEQFAFGSDVQLVIDPPAMVLRGADRNAQPFGNGHGRMSGQNELHQLPFPRAEIRPQPVGQMGLACRGNAWADESAVTGRLGGTSLDIKRMKSLEGRQPLVEDLDL